MTQVEFTDEKVLQIINMGNQDVDTDKKFVPNSVSLTPEYPVEIVEGFNSSGKTQYIRSVLKCLNQALNIGHVNAESMRIGNLSQYAYMDRIVSSGRSSDLSS